ncbi:flavodoxin reductase [Ectothiorhodospiraceae bacterium WFHF3C12]|nr:flavodoxin reductase [Ectothiorhodospiraceae bacterium WFHF3C12]
MPHAVQVLNTHYITPDVIRLMVTKPDGWTATLGSSVRLAVPNVGLNNRWRPFSITSHPSDPILEFLIKIYEKKESVTALLASRVPGDTLLISNPFDGIDTNDVAFFIAAGTGVTPFLPILRHRSAKGLIDNEKLLLSSKTPADVICGHELRSLLGSNFVSLCTREADHRNRKGRVTESVIEEMMAAGNPRVAVCGPSQFVIDVCKFLNDLGLPRNLVVT